ncbi:MAG TPA: MG2 domain-containing protein, partial [Chitinophagaceae bacterium]|nr:MG2 domain-containing protein [Chitinophagaceae bacterium]
MSRVFLLIGWILSFLSTYSQDFRASDWRRIDSNINEKSHIVDVAQQLQELRQQALAKKKYFQVARTYFYQLRIADQRTEDSFYFRNSVFIDSILGTRLNPELELAMHLLQAKRLSGFASGTGSMRFNRQRYERKDIPVNYATYTDRQLDSLAQWHCEQAKKLAKNIPTQEMEEVLWLSSDPWLFLFRPGLFDIIIAEQINMLKKSYYYSLPMDSKQLRALSLSQDEFIGEIGSLYNDDYLLQLKYYKEWLDYQRGNPSAYYFIETLARKSLYQVMTRRYSEIDRVKRNYESYLSVISVSPYNTVKAHGVYQLCLLWNQDSKKYFPSNAMEYDSRAGTYVFRRQFDTAYRYHAAKALRLYENNEQMLDSFSYLKAILVEMKGKILETNLSLSMESYNLPGEPILTQLSYKNAGRLFYRVVRVNQDFPYYKYKHSDELYGLVKHIPQAAGGMVDLPGTHDFNKHATHLKLDALPVGDYLIVFSHLPLSDTSAQIESVFFRVSSIAILQENKRVFVLDRKTGFPLRGAKAKGSYWHDPADTLGLKKVITKNYTVNAQGYIEIQDMKIRALEVYHNGDTAYSVVYPIDEEEGKSDDVYSKDEYDDLAEYYEENATVEVFTDRSIYRPGQTVHFKALFTTLDPQTGQPIVMSRQNMKGSLFRSSYKKWLKREEPELYLLDPFGNEVDTIKIKLNDYGTLSGSFKIPKAASPGEWSIEPDYLEVSEENEGSFRVEEYKRPTYEVSMEKPKKELLPGDSFAVKLKVKSFAGAALNNVRVNYRVSRTGAYSIYDSVTGKLKWENVQEIADTTGYTNEEGEFEIIVSDPFLGKYARDKNERLDFIYSINAEAMDQTGETYEAEASVRISTMPVSIRVPVETSYDRNAKNSIMISTNDENAGIVSKDINVKVYRIIKDEKPYNDRKLIGVDQWLYEKQQLEQWFPLVNFNGIEDTGTKKFLFEQTVNTGKNDKIDFDPAILLPGNYMIEATCIENGYRRGYSKKTFSIYDENENRLPQRGPAFYRLPLNSFSPGDTVKYLNGNSESPVYSVYYLKYFSEKKKGGVGYYFENRKQERGISRFEWKIPANAGSQALLTQFYVLNNQLFTHTETIYINDNAIAEPEIIVEQYRKKLSPGAKENFVVSIKTKNENIAAELMTTLYDASLDKLEPHKWTKPLERRRGRYLQGDRNNYFNSGSNSENYYYYNNYDDGPSMMRGTSTSALWWVNPLDPAYDDEPAYAFSTSIKRVSSLGSEMLEGRAAGLSLTDADGLNEVVVVGYGSMKKMDVTGSVVRIRGTSTLASYSQLLIILDGVPYEGGLGKLDPNSIKDAIVLKGADAAAIYGSRASNGVLVLSTKGPIVFPDLPPDPPLPPRKNFNESAFFFPTVYADKDGYYRISFTMPESVTEWNWKMLAHTKQLQFAYAEKKLNTQLPLMVQPNMPRLLYQGDRIVLQSRISNLDSAEVNGKVVCRVEDVVTGEDLTSLLVAGAEKDFSVGKKSNTATAFELKVPATQLNPVKIIVSVRTRNFSDGEEHIIPVLSPKILVKESIPFRLVKNMDTVLQPFVVPTGTELYGMGLSILSKPQAALVNALPYLANYSFDCAEQTFNKLLANVTAFWLMRNDHEAQRSFDIAKQSIEKLPEQKEQLPDEL